TARPGYSGWWGDLRFPPEFPWSPNDGSGYGLRAPVAARPYVAGLPAPPARGGRSSPAPASSHGPRPDRFCSPRPPSSPCPAHWRFEDRGQTPARRRWVGPIDAPGTHARRHSSPARIAGRIRFHDDQWGCDAPTGPPAYVRPTTNGRDKFR